MKELTLVIRDVLRASLVPIKHGLPALLATFLLSSCASLDPRGGGGVERFESGGFEITEDTRFDLSARSDFRAALALLEEERYAEGIRLLEAVVEAAPEATLAHINLGVAYAATGELGLAAESLGRALSLNPSHPASLNELGIVRRRQGRFAEARSHYEAALDRYPGFHLARRNLAILCDVYLNDRPCALEHYERYAAVSPEDQKVSMWIADLRNRVEE